MKRLSAGLLILVVWLGLSARLEAFASVNLPLHHWAYVAIERLVDLQVIDLAMVTPKPYSRLEAARAVARAIARIKSNQIPIDGRERIAERLLERLIEEFHEELRRISALAPSRHRHQQRRNRVGSFRFGGRLQVEGNSSWIGEGQTVRFRANRAGEYSVNGLQAQVDVRGWVEVGNWLALAGQPKFISNPRILGIGATANDKQFYLRTFSLKLSLANIALEVGRETTWWGPGYHGSLLLTDHAFPLEMIKLYSDEPFHLPWVFRVLGQWKIQSFLGPLERDRDFPRAKLFGLRISWLPSRWVELGATRLTQFDGRGRGQSFPQAIIDAYTKAPNRAGDLEVNEQAMLDIRLRLPRVPYVLPFPAGLQLYGELGSEDKWSQFLLPSRVAFLTGLYIPQLFKGDSLDLRIEYADTDLARRRHPELAGVWYKNGTYVSGMRHRGFPLGHHMGTDGIDVFIRTTQFVTNNLQVGINMNWQERPRGLDGSGLAGCDMRDRMSRNLVRPPIPSLRYA
ncbi:MAG: capsule assembly Wzi family protein [Nitrospirae bacterium]|nr:MAG: capsule assembly Wzi family protein [Nitrospirota bacterium]